MENKNLEFITDFQLFQIAEHGGLNTELTVDFCKKELERRKKCKYDIFKQYENKIFIKKSPEYITLIKFDKYNILDQSRLSGYKLEFNTTNDVEELWFERTIHKHKVTYTIEELEYCVLYYDEIDIKKWNYYNTKYEELDKLFNDKYTEISNEK